MAQEETTIPPKSDEGLGDDQLTPAEFNELTSTINSNASDISTREPEQEERTTRLEHTATNDIQNYATENLPSDRVDGTFAFDTSMEVPLYSRAGQWYRCSDEAPLSGFTEVDMFLVMGQSNADGKADVNNLDPGLAGLDRSNIQMYAGSADQTTLEWIPGTWGVMDVGVNTSQAGNRYGPEVGFADTIKAIVDGGGNSTYSKPLAILKHAKGATDLAVNWDAPDGYVYKAMEKSLPDAKYNLGQLNYKFNIRGLIWYQGESDAGDLSKANNYESNLNAFFLDVRTRLGVSDLPIVICKVDYTDGNEPTYLATVRQALQNVADADANIGIIDTDIYSRRDVVHLDAAGMYQLGVDIVPIMVNAIAGTT